MQWQRTAYSLIAMCNDFLSKDNLRLTKKNENLNQATEQLRKENERLKQQLRKVLGKGNKKQISRNQNQDSECGENSAQSCPDGDASEGRKKKKRGAPKGHIGNTRAIPDKVDSVEIIPPPDVCPGCGQSHIIETPAFRSKYIEDIPPLAKQVIEKRYREGICSHCHTPVIHPNALEGPPVTIGPNLTAALTMMRQQLGATYRKLSRFSSEVFQIPLSPSGVFGIINRMSYKLEPLYKGIEAGLPDEAVLHADETGWNMDGANWYLWCFCNRRMTYFHLTKSRGAKVPKSILGEDYKGILHADFYAAYDFVKKTQRCIIHLQRDIYDELEVSPEDTVLHQLKEGINSIIDRARQIRERPRGLLSLSQEEREKVKKEMEAGLQGLIHLDSSNQKTEAFLNRIFKYKMNLLRFLDHHEVEFHNNRAERAIRPAVIFRKTSFGNRTPQGAYLYSILTSVIETYRLKGKDINEFLKQVHLTPIEKMARLNRVLIDTS
ncbi:MAG: IS66 family transposase [Desulfobacteraceae bacterium]|nr:IS66 family transposase [Desulfobacteraceae bacterium]